MSEPFPSSPTARPAVPAQGPGPAGPGAEHGRRRRPVRATGVRAGVSYRDQIEAVRAGVARGRFGAGLGSALVALLEAATQHVPGDAAVSHPNDCALCKKPFPCSLRRHADAIADGL